MGMNSLETTSTALQLKEQMGQLLRENYAEITFTKKDGTTRVMKCTLREGEAIPYEKKTDRTRDPKDNILPVWDLEAAAWRSINVDTIEEVKVYGDS